MNYHFLLLYLLDCQLQLNIAYESDFVASLLKQHGFRRAYLRVRQLREWGLFTERYGLLYLTEKPLARLNRHELDQLPVYSGEATEPEELPLEQHLYRERHGWPRPSVEALHSSLPAGCFSIFSGPISNPKPYERVCTIQGLYYQIQHPRQHRRQIIDAVRAAYGTPEADRLKQKLPYVTPAGVFSERKANGLLSLSGFGVLDFDDLADAEQAKAALIADEELWPMLALVFISPSGHGLKVLVELPKDAEYTTGLRVIAACISSRCPQLQHDQATSDIARACFLSFDAKPWLHPKYRE